MEQMVGIAPKGYVTAQVGQKKWLGRRRVCATRMLGEEGRRQAGCGAQEVARNVAPRQAHPWKGRYVVRWGIRMRHASPGRSLPPMSQVPCMSVRRPTMNGVWYNSPKSSRPRSQL